MKKLKYIAVFCSANDLAEKYNRPARELARKMINHGYHLVWGASDKGLMKVVADEIQIGGGKLVGVTTKHFFDVARKTAHKIILTPSLSRRKAVMLFRCDAVVALVGGTGTLDELTDIIELKKIGDHTKPVVVLNTENFYEGLKVQLQKMKDDGFIKKSLDELVYFADKPNEAIEYINKSLKAK